MPSKYKQHFEEIWINTGNKESGQGSHRKCTILQFSNFGRIRLSTGEIKAPSTYQSMRFNGKVTRLHRAIAEVFIPKTEEDIAKNRTHVDHITKTPQGYYYNDVRNLRWCTPKENNNFEEHRMNDKLALANDYARKARASERRKQLNKTNVGSHWFNNGTISFRSKECPEGFVPGRIYNRRNHD